MYRIAFKMKLKPGFEQEYKLRHDALWPELHTLLKNTGIEDYSIFLDEGTLDLIGVLKLKDASAIDKLPNNIIMKKWWAYMADIMEVNEDNSPKSTSLLEVFYMS
jgi:L-rhamnose mutarotase